MKKTVLFITALLLMGSTAGAQGLLGRLGERAKNAVEENIGNKVEQGVNDILNGKKKDKKNNKGKEETICLRFLLSSRCIMYPLM